VENSLGKNYQISERKSSGFGSVGTTSKQSGLEKVWSAKPFAYYVDMKRKDAYVTCRDRYQYDQLARPIINMIVHAIFSRPPDFQGDEKLVKRAQKVVRDSEINWTTWGADLETYGDVFIDIEYDQSNVLDIKNYIQFMEEPNSKNISPDEMSHLKINALTDLVFGSGTLRPGLYWFDVLDNLWERNALRAAQYYGYPLIAVTGIPGEHQDKVQIALQADGQRPGRIWVFPEGTKVEAPDLTKSFPISELLDRVYQYILASCSIPQHLVYESDSSRGVAMFSADGFEMMIKARREIWTLGLIRAMRQIFEDEGLWKDDSEFNINWAPVFLRDLKNVAELMKVAVENSVISKHTAREMINVDHSREEERMEDEPEDPLVQAEMDALKNPPAANVPAKGGKPAPAKPRPRSNK